MVYQHFTLVPNMTVAENLILGEEELPSIIDWRALREKIETFQESMPFRLDPDRMVSSLAAGRKAKTGNPETAFPRPSGADIG